MFVSSGLASILIYSGFFGVGMFLKVDLIDSRLVCLFLFVRLCLCFNLANCLGLFCLELGF